MPDPRVVIDVIVNSDQAKKAFADITKSADKMGDSLLGFGKAATIGITAPLAAIGTAAVMAASDLEESMSKVGVVFGSASDEVEAFAETAASSLGISEQAALEATGTYGNLLRAIGLTEDASAEMSTSLVALSADLASFNNLETDEVLEKLRAGLTGEAEPLKTLGINMNAARLEAKALELGLIAQGEALDAAAKTQAAYAIMMEDTALAQGDFARTSDGLANSTKILQAQLQDALASLGEALLPTITKLVQNLVKLVEMFNALPQPVKNTTVALAGVAAAAGPVSSVLGGIMKLVGIIKGAAGFGGFATAAKGAATALTGASGALSGMTASISAALPMLGLLGVAVGALIVVWNEFGEEAKVAGEQLLFIIGFHLDQLAKGFEEAVRNILGLAITFGLNIVNGIKEGIQSGWTALVSFVQNLARDLLESAKNALQIASPSQEFAAVGAAIPQGMAQGITQAQQVAINALKNALGPMAGAMDAYIETVIRTGDPLNDWITHLPDEFHDAALAIGQSIAGGLTPAVTDAGDASDALATDSAPMTDMLTDIPMLATDAGASLDQFTMTVQNMGNTLRSYDWAGIGRAVTRGIADGIKSDWQYLINLVKKLANEMKETAQQELEISSPSKVFARDVGAPIAQGIGVGFSRAMPAVDATIAGGVGALAPMAAGAGGGGAGITVNVAYNPGVSFASQAEIENELQPIIFEQLRRAQRNG